ncbi:hypothetical protein Tco_0198867 [Tanacetum coccineum]
MLTTRESGKLEETTNLTPVNECGSLRHFKSECPIVKFQKHVDKKISTLAERQTENKRNDKKPYGGSRPLCSKCNYHHDGPCALKRYKCNKYGHIACDCKGMGNANAVNNQRGYSRQSQNAICYEWESKGTNKRIAHSKKEPKP